VVEREPIGIVGLGNMGISVATRLAERYRVVGFDPYPSQRARQMVEDGRLQLVDAPLGTVVGEAVVLSLPTPAISRDIVAAIAAAPALRLIVETSTVSPSDMAATAALCVPHSVALVDAAILAGVQPMLDGTATLLVGGDDAAVEIARPVLESFSAEIQVIGPLGAGMAAKVINNAVAHAVMVILAEAGALAAANGIPRARIAELLSGRDGGLIRPLEHRFKERVLTGDYVGGMPTDAARKDSTLALQLGQDGHVPLFGIQAAHTVYELAVSAGLDKLDYASIATLWETWTGRSFSDDA